MQELIDATGKHASYQPLPDFLSDVFDGPKIDESWRSTRPQLDLIRRFGPELPETIIELGANLGFVSLSLAFEHPEKRIIAVEAHAQHAHFINTVAERYELNLTVINEATPPQRVMLQFPKAALLDFNVAHHFGVDLTSTRVHSSSEWWNALGEWIGPPSKSLRFLQIGYNWGGAKDRPLHDSQDVSGFADRILANLPSHTALYCVSAPRFTFEQCAIDKLTPTVDDAYDKLGLVGEYWRRPIFVF